HTRHHWIHLEVVDRRRTHLPSRRARLRRVPVRTGERGSGVARASLASHHHRCRWPRLGSLVDARLARFAAGFLRRPGMDWRTVTARLILVAVLLGTLAVPASG